MLHAALRRLLPATLLCLTSALASAGTIRIDFEHTPGADGILGTADDVAMPNDFVRPLSDEFAGMGLRFTRGSIMTSGFFDGNPANHFLSSTYPIATLDMPVTGIAIDSYSYWDVTLTAFDADHNVLAQQVLANPGGGFFRGHLAVTTTQAIASFSIMGPSADKIINLDNLELSDGAPVSVPEPSCAALLALGLAAGGLARRRRQ